MFNYWKRQDHAGKTALANFSAQFFLMCMGTGILSVNLKTLPYQFNGLSTISIIIWLLDVALFLSIAAVFTARIIFFPTSTLTHFIEDVEQTDYISTVAISASTIVEMTALILGKSWDGWGTVSMVLWYCSVVLAAVAAFLPYWIMIRDEKTEVANLPPTALYPATALLSAAASGSVVATYSSLTIRAIQPIVLLSFTLLGVGFLLALAILANYTSRLLTNSSPPPEKAMSSFVPVASISNAGYAVTALGRLVGPSKNILAEYGRGYAADPGVGIAIYGFGIIAALGLIGFATWWMFQALATVVADIRRAPFTMSYWSSLYPWGVYALAFGQLGQDFDSPTFKVLNTIMTLLLLLNWLFCIAMTVPRMISGEVFLEDVEETHKNREKWSRRRHLRPTAGQQQNSRDAGGSPEQQHETV